MSVRSIKKEDLLKTLEINVKDFECGDIKVLIPQIIKGPVKKDFTPRTVINIGKLIKEGKNSQDSGFDEVLEQFAKYISKKVEQELLYINSQKDFDIFHNDLCEKFLELFGNKKRQVKNVKISDIQYGKAQKVVNMFFNYFFLLYGNDGNNNYVDDKYDNIYQYCHMPLDSFTLNWVKYVVCDTKDNENGDVSKKIKDVINKTSWSNLCPEDYKSIQHAIRKFLKEQHEKDKENAFLPKEPFYAEFYIWREEQLYESLKTISTEDFKWAIAKDYNINKELKEIQGKIKDIIEKMDSYKGSRKNKKN